MSAPQTACVAAADVSHPEWCDREWCDTTCAAVDHLGHAAGSVCIGQHFQSGG